MGNYISCTLSSLAPKQSRGIKVIYPSGEIRHFYHPINAAELMLEWPHHFVVNARSLTIGRRFCALAADEDLEISNVYAVFPMKRLCSAVTAADVGGLFLAAKRVTRGHVRVLPDECEKNDDDDCDLPRLSLEGIEELSSPEFKQRLSNCRSKKPLLETIDEER